MLGNTLFKILILGLFHLVSFHCRKLYLKKWAPLKSETDASRSYDPYYQIKNISAKWVP